ncbi:MAG: LPS export ABC transporter permease LptG [Nitrospinota bacterium]
MRLLTRYVGSQFLRILWVSLLAFLTIYLIVEFFERVDDFLEKSAPLTAMIAYFAYKIPEIVMQVGPAAILLSSVFSLLILGRNNEITAMRACGLSLYRLALPILVWGAIGSLALFLAGEYLLPITNRKVNQIVQVHIRKRPPKWVIRKNNIWYRSENRIIWHIQSFDPDRNLLKNVTLYRLSPSGRILERVDAKTVQWDGRGWAFRNGRHRKFSSQGITETEGFAEARALVTERPEDFKQIKKEPGEMNLGEMRDYIRGLRANGVDDTKYVVDMNAKLAYPLVGLIMALVGIPFSLKTGRSGGLARSLVLTLVIGFSYFILFYTGVSLGHAGTLPPFVAAWSTNIIFLAAGAYLMATVRG